MNVSHILESTFRKFDDKIRVTAKLIKTDDESNIWSKDYDKDYQELFELQNELSQAIASNLLEHLTGQEIAEIKTNRPINIEAYENYLKANYLLLAK